MSGPLRKTEIELKVITDSKPLQEVNKQVDGIIGNAKKASQSTGKMEKSISGTNKAANSAAKSFKVANGSIATLNKNSLNAVSYTGKLNKGLNHVSKTTATTANKFKLVSGQVGTFSGHLNTAGKSANHLKSSVNKLNSQTSRNMSNMTKSVGLFGKAWAGTKNNFINGIKSASSNAKTATGGIKSSFQSITPTVNKVTSNIATGISRGITAPLQSAVGMVKTYAGAMGMLSAGALGATGMGRLSAIENANVSLEVMMGNAKRASSFLDDVLAFARTTPFAFPDLAETSRNLIAFGMESKKVVPTLKAIGDAAAGTGKGAEGLRQISGAFGDMQISSTLSLEPVRRLESAGVPALKILANAAGVSADDFAKSISKGMIDSQESIDTLVKGMQKGTKGVAGETAAMAGLMERMKSTWVGSVDSLKSSISSTSAKIMEPLKPHIQAGMKWVGDTFSKLPDVIFAVVKPVSNVFGFLKNGIAAVKEMMVTTGDMTWFIDNFGLDKAVKINNALWDLVGVSEPLRKGFSKVTDVIKGIRKTSESSIPPVELFGEKISESTKKAVGSFLELSDKATSSLDKMQWLGKKVTKDMAGSIISDFKEMNGKIVDGIKDRNAKSKESLQKLLAESKALTDKEKAAALKKVDQRTQEEVKLTEKGQKKIQEILNKASKEKREITEQERQAINDIQEKMVEQGVQVLSKGEVEFEAILERMKAQAGNLSAQQAVEVAQNANKQRDKSVKEAKKQAEQTIQEYEYQRDVLGSLSKDQAAKLIQEATTQRDKTVEKAEDMHKKIIDGAKKKAGDHAGLIDWETGEVLTKWEAFKQGVSQHLSGVEKSGFNALASIKTAFSGIMDIFKGNTDQGKDVLSGILPESVVNQIVTSVGTVKTIFGTVKETALSLAPVVGGVFKNIFTLYQNMLPFFSAISKGLSSLVTFVFPYLKAGLDGVVGFIKDVTGQIAGFWEENGGQITQAVQNIGKVLGAVFKVLMPVIGVIVKAVWGNIKGAITGAIDVITGVIKFFSSLFTGDFKGMWESVKKIFFGGIKFAWNAINLLFVGRIIGGIRSLVLGARGLITGMWSSIKNYFTGGSKNIWGIVKNMTGKIKAGFSSMKEKAVDIAISMYTRMKTIFGDIIGAAKALPGKMGSGIKKMAGKAVDGIKSTGNKMLKKIGSVVNGVIDGLNFAMKGIGLNITIDNWPVPQYATGTKYHPGGPAILGDGGQHELFRTPQGHVGLSPATDTMMNLPKGTQVLSGGQTQQVFQRAMPAYNDGNMFGNAINKGLSWIKDTATGAMEKGKVVMDGAKSVATKVKDKALDVFDYVSNPSKLMSKLMEKFGVVMPSFSGAFGDIAKGAFNMVKDKALDYLTSKMDFFDFGGGGGGFSFPGFTRTSGYGMRWGVLHKGVDYAAPTGTPIPSQSSGKVIYSGFGKSGSGYGGYGNAVHIASGNGLSFLYGHNSKNLVKTGDMVRKGQTIGLVGSTGYSTGPHVHFEVRRNGLAINPDSQGFAGGGKVSGSLGKWIAAAMARAGVSGSNWASGLSWIINKESSGNPNAVGAMTSSGTAKGLMQLKDFNIRGNPFDPVNNIFHGIKYIKGRYKTIESALNWWRSHNWYAKGTKNHKGGLAVLGDGGMNELFRTPQGQVGLSPDFATLMNLPRGSEVLSGNETQHAFDYLSSSSPSSSSPSAVTYSPTIYVQVTGGQGQTTESNVKRAVREALDEMWDNLIPMYSPEGDY